MTAAGHLRTAFALFLALTLGFAGATKRARSDDADSEKDWSLTRNLAVATAALEAKAVLEAQTALVSLVGLKAPGAQAALEALKAQAAQAALKAQAALEAQTALEAPKTPKAPKAKASTSTRTNPAIKSRNLHFLKRIIQSLGCLFSDAVACSGDFDDPMRHAAILLSHVYAKAHPEYEPAKSSNSDLSSVEQLRNELVRQLEPRSSLSHEVDSVGAEELLLTAAKQLIALASWASNERDLCRRTFSTTRAWEGKKALDDLALSGLNEVFMAAEKTTARFDRSVFVWPAGQSSRSPLYPEERLYAAAVAIMCKRLGVRPVSVFLFTRTYETFLCLDRLNWRRSTIQVIAMAVDEPVNGLDLFESCGSLVEKLGISEQLEFVPKMQRHRRQPSSEHEPKSQPHSMPVLAGPAEPPLPPTLLATPLPTVLREEFAEADRLLLIRSLQVAYLLLSQAAVDQRSLGDPFYQASSVISHLLKLNGHDLPPYLITHKPGMRFTPLDLLRVVAEADRRPDLSAVSTVGDVMTAAAQTIFRHLYLALPITVLTKVEEFNAVEFPESQHENMEILTSLLLSQETPHVLNDSSSFARLYEASDAILWAVFRIFSKRRGNSDAAFVLCTREMDEKIPIARQQTHYLIPAIIRKMFGDKMRSIEAAVLNLLVYLVFVSDHSNNLQMPAVMPQSSGTVVQAQDTTFWGHITTIMSQTIPVTNQTAIAADQVAIMASQIASRYPRNDTDPVFSKTVIVMRDLFPNGSMQIRSLSDIPVVVLQDLPMDLEKAGELASANRLAATSQLHTLDAKLKRDRIPFSETDHVTVLMDALVALHFLQKGTVAQLARIPRTHTSDTSPEDKHNLTRLLVAALFKATSVKPAKEGSMSTAFSELTKMLASAVEATIFS